MLSFHVIVAVRPICSPAPRSHLLPITRLSTKRSANSSRMNTCESLSKQRTLSACVITTIRKSLCPHPIIVNQFCRQEMVPCGVLPFRRSRHPFCYHPASHLRPCRRGRRDEF